jgi:protein-S-isoprenylcysteine O-methyltransferase Ste14
MSRTAKAAVGSVLWFVLAPGSVAGLGPWLITNWRVDVARPWWAPPVALGWGLVALGLPVLLHAFMHFFRVGRGTPAPYMPPDRLVVTGFYRFVRNPMYTALISILSGETLLFWNRSLLLYTGIVTAVFHLFVIAYEEPRLRRLFGASYAEYCRHVRRWWPRFRAWNPRQG